MTGKAKVVAWIVIVNVVAWGALYFLYDLTYHVKPPNPPSQEELHAIETRFPQVRATLERIVAFEARSEWRTLRAIRDSLARSGDFDGLALLQTQFDEHDRQIEKVLREVRPPLPRADARVRRVDARSESLIYVPMLARRGRGAGAPWVYAGYVYASGWAPDATQRLDEHWSVYSDVKELSWGAGASD